MDIERQEMIEIEHTDQLIVVILIRLNFLDIGLKEYHKSVGLVIVFSKKK